MKRTIVLLAMALVFLFAAVGPVSAVKTPLYFPGDPGNGLGEGEDGDHPWGGDRVIGDGVGSTSTRIVRTSALTGYPAVDIFINNVLNYLAPQEHKRDDLTGRLNSSARARYRFSLSREAQR